MNCITDILTAKIFAFSGGDIKCQSSSQIADRLASTQTVSAKSGFTLLCLSQCGSLSSVQTPPRSPFADPSGANRIALP